MPPVVTLIGARNMWLNAHVRLRKTFHDLGAKMVGTVALIDKNSNTISAVTILYWMLTGKKGSLHEHVPQTRCGRQ